MDGLLSASFIVSKFIIHPVPKGGRYRAMHYFDILYNSTQLKPVIELCRITNMPGPQAHLIPWLTLPYDR